MKLSVTLVPVRKIKPSASRWNFVDDEIEQAAHLIAEAEGMVQPIVLQREDGFESYIVIEGDFEYYAAARASELEPHTCECIPAFLIESASEADQVRQQIQLFRDRRSAPNQPANSQDIEARIRELERRQTSLEARQILLESHEIKILKQQVEELKNQLCPRSNLLDLFNSADHAELLHQMKRAGLTGKNAEKIVETIDDERKYRLFDSLRDVVVRIKGLTYEKMVDLVENE